MDRCKPTLVVILLIGLAGCQTSRVATSPESTLLSEPREIPAGEQYKHTPSGNVFPAQVSGFRRVHLRQYDDAALNISAGYEDANPACRIALTIYAYPTPGMTFVGADPAVVRSLEAEWLESSYSGAKQAILALYPHAVLESEEARSEKGARGRKAVFAVGDQLSALYVFVIDQSWHLKYRQSYPRRCTAEARRAIDAFHAAWLQSRPGQ